MDKQRITYVDLGAGIMILWMIFQHAVQSAWQLDSLFPIETYKWNPNVWFPYLNFFMPWFFYKSGAFFHKRNVKDLWLKDSHKFLRIFIIWSLIGYVAYLILGAYDHTLTLHDALYMPTRRFFLRGYIWINAPLWFLLTLFGVRFVGNLVLPDNTNNYKHVICTIIVSVSAFVAYAMFKFDNPYKPDWVANGAAGLAFFTMGYWLNKYENVWWFVALSLIGYLCSCLFGWNSVQIHGNRLLEGYYLLWFPAALCGIVSFNVACRLVCEWIDKITPPCHSRVRILETVGKNAMPIYVTHAFVQYPIQTILTQECEYLEWHYILLIICIGYAIFLPINCMLWNKCYNQK